MSEHRTGEEAQQYNIALMGEPLGVQYSLLWQELAALHAIWHEYEELFGTNPERVQVLNEASRWFAFLIQEELWSATLLGIARITDPSSTGKKANLTVQNLGALVSDAHTRAEVDRMVKDALEKTIFCRDMRNRRIAHRDLDLALKNSATTVPAATRNEVNEALAALAAILNANSLRYKEGHTEFRPITSNGALSLLYVLDEGLRAREQRVARLKSGKAIPEDVAPRRTL